MKAQNLTWLGTKTQRFDETINFFGGVLGLRCEHEEPDFAVFGSGDRHHDHFTTGPVVRFQVDDVQAARSELEEAGILFFGPVHTREDGGSWSHFVGPDGNVYELTRGDART